MKHTDTSVPCYNCPKRCVTSDYNCHSDCAEYKAYKELNREKMEKIIYKRDEEHMMYEVKARGVKKVNKGRSQR